MSAIESELVAVIRRLDSERQQRVLDFARELEQPVQKKVHTPSELMELPLEERNRILLASIELAADEDFEIFEAYSEEEIDDTP